MRVESRSRRSKSIRASLLALCALGGAAWAILAACAGPQERFTSKADAEANDASDAATTSDAFEAPDASTLDAADAAPLADVEIDEDIVVDTHWVKQTRYHLKPKTGVTQYILVKNGAALIIDPGTQILAGPGSALVVSRGAAILATGTALEPIVFTEDSALGSRRPGQWGGLVLLGRATVARPPGVHRFEALPAGLEQDAEYGGDKDDDSSGVLKFVRIEFPGYAYAADKPFSGLTLAGVGDRTIIDSVQVHRGAGDGISFIGGRARFTHLMSTSNADDGISITDAWQGLGQFVAIQLGETSSADACGYDVERSEQILPTAGGFSIWNGTVAGRKGALGSSFAAWFHARAQGELVNHVFMNFSTSSLRIQGAESETDWANRALTIRNSIFFDNAPGGGNFADTDADFDEAPHVLSADRLNRETAPMLFAPLDLLAPNFPAKNGLSPIYQGYAVPTSNTRFFDGDVVHVGAMRFRDWSDGWTAYPVN